MCGDATSWDENAYRERILKEREIPTLTVFRTPLGFSNANAQQVEPTAFLQGHEGPAYDVKFYGEAEDALLLSCGDDGRIRGWKWKEFTQLEAPISLKGIHIQPVLDLMNPQHKGPWGALSPIPENNAIAVDKQEGCIFSAVGDSCAYCWDVETSKIKMVFKGHLDYLHCIVARNSTNQAFSNGQNLSVWNLPASECVTRASIRASIQDVIFEDNQVLAVGAEPLLSRFDINGAIVSQIPCAPQSAFSVSIHPSGVIAVGGYGALVDIISQFGSHYCTFRCKCV
ncbi:hypothetical protein GH714_038720 [Hevea brasiliensis]|uniref:Uncharacterized protein n=1 Tax=Hevea brasiliensis TaxID=3981 RepID=A0A6A6LC27_HEVBR|nr:hypothetical protein GH714_038720 [Hevea brasiliensis]